MLRLRLRITVVLFWVGLQGCADSMTGGWLATQRGIEADGRPSCSHCVTTWVLTLEEARDGQLNGWACYEAMALGEILAWEAQVRRRRNLDSIFLTIGPDSIGASAAGVIHRQSRSLHIVPTMAPYGELAPLTFVPDTTPCPSGRPELGVPLGAF